MSDDCTREPRHVIVNPGGKVVEEGSEDWDAATVRTPARLSQPPWTCQPCGEHQHGVCDSLRDLQGVSFEAGDGPVGPICNCYSENPDMHHREAEARLTEIQVPPSPFEPGTPAWNDAGIVEVMEDLIDVDEAARIAQVSVATMRRMCESEKVRAKKVGQQWAIHRPSVPKPTPEKMIDRLADWIMANAGDRIQPDKDAVDIVLDLLGEAKVNEGVCSEIERELDRRYSIGQTRDMLPRAVSAALDGTYDNLRPPGN